MSSESLEGKLKPDWKQWIPIYGIYQTEKDFDEGKPVIMNRACSSYQALSSIAVSAGVIYGLFKLAGKLF